MRFSIVFLAVLLPIAYAASCTSDKYCPLGWAVKRIGKEYAAMTCEPTDRNRKCPKPYACIASHCQINFCCANEKLLEKLAREEENKQDDEQEAEDEL